MCDVLWRNQNRLSSQILFSLFCFSISRSHISPMSARFFVPLRLYCACSWLLHMLLHHIKQNWLNSWVIVRKVFIFRNEILLCLSNDGCAIVTVSHCIFKPTSESNVCEIFIRTHNSFCGARKFRVYLAKKKYFQTKNSGTDICTNVVLFSIKHVVLWCLLK